MKIKGIILFIVSIVFLSCQREKQYTCSQNNYFPPLQMFFIGFDTSDLDTFYVERYNAATDFTDLISRDTAKIYSFTLSADSIFRGSTNAGWGSFGEGSDYKIIIPSLGLTYEITNITKGDTVTSWVQNSPCGGRSRTFIGNYKTISIDGIPSRFYYVGAPSSFAIEKK